MEDGVFFEATQAEPLEGQGQTRAERRDQQIQRILEAAQACFVRSGFQGAVERGEIDPPVDLQTLMAVLLSVGEGIAINDLPARGIPLDQIEAALRAMLVGMLRPTDKGASEKA